MSLNLAIIVLTYNESIHISRCRASVDSLDARVLVVDSYSTDGTQDICRSLGVEVYENRFVNQAQQFQWAMDNCNVETEWVLRLDADETLDDDLINEIKKFINADGYGHNGAIFHRKHIFLGKWIKHGGRYPLPMLRLFRKGFAHIEQRWMDEHIVLDLGISTFLKGGFEDNNLNSVSWFIDKHNKYATREMVDIMLHRLFPDESSEISSSTSFKIKLKRFVKERVYNQLPYFIRPTLYFIYRYFFQLGFLDGSRGFAYHFMQGFWYRSLVDLKCMEIERLWNECESKEQKLRALETYSGYTLRDQ
jgi:glycosyltransferase involved in cell wall biosynthesis